METPARLATSLMLTMTSPSFYKTFFRMHMIIGHFSAVVKMRRGARGGRALTEVIYSIIIKTTDNNRQ
jgi:hypothetical protein